MKRLKEAKCSDLGLPTDSYIYSFAKVTVDQHDNTCSLAVISSDESLRIFDVERLDTVENGIFHSVHSSVTGLARFLSSAYSPLLLTSGRDGCVRGWDTRSGGKAVEISAPKGEPLSALACDAGLHAILAGTELEKDGPGDVSVYGWDIRNPGELVIHYAESHTDTITELGFVSTDERVRGVLFSASTDGLINLYDSSIRQEEDAVLQVINHQSAIHHAGLVGDDFYALGMDETLSFYAQQLSETVEDGPPPVHLGDVREPLDCNYVVGIVQAPETPVIVTGNYSEQPHVDLIPLSRDKSTSSPAWAPNLDERIRLVGGHGSEVVRDSVILGTTVFTCGEDGMVRVWKSEPGERM
jgi:WD40 repeat protein